MCQDALTLTGGLVGEDIDRSPVNTTGRQTHPCRNSRAIMRRQKNLTVRENTLTQIRNSGPIHVYRARATCRVGSRGSRAAPFLLGPPTPPAIDLGTAATKREPQIWCVRASGPEPLMGTAVGGQLREAGARTSTQLAAVARFPRLWWNQACQ